jgi:hypothetical protein
VYVRASLRLWAGGVQLAAALLSIPTSFREAPTKTVKLGAYVDNPLPFKDELQKGIRRRRGGPQVYVRAQGWEGQRFGLQSAKPQVLAAGPKRWIRGWVSVEWPVERSNLNAL